MKFTFKIFFIFILLSKNIISQNKLLISKKTALIQFSGVVLDQDSLTRIPFVSIHVINTKRYYVSDNTGFFSLIVTAGDEIEFHSISHKNRIYKVSDTLKSKYYYAIQLLTKDTIQLQEIEIFPWPSKEEFRRAFLALNLNETDQERGSNNLLRQDMTYLERTQPSSASENYKYVMQAYYTKVYTSGQQPENNLLNPIKWAQFIDSWRKAKYNSKNKKN